VDGRETIGLSMRLHASPGADDEGNPVSQ
jgi:hypothetical protein